jgi:hypothetical protein
MKKLTIAAGTAILAVCFFACTHEVKVPDKTVARLEAHLSAKIGDQLTRENEARRVPMTVSVDKVGISRIAASETAQDFKYLVRGTVTYHRNGPSRWKDQFGNEVHADAGTSITRWFSCGVLEDRSLGSFFDDIDNRLILYADKPED